jgi:hypothetical protein
VLADPSLTQAKGSTFSFSLGVLLIWILGFSPPYIATWRPPFGGNVEKAISVFPCERQFVDSFLLWGRDYNLRFQGWKITT